MSGRTYMDAFGILSSLTDIKIDFFSTEPAVDENGTIIGETKTVEQQIVMSLPLAKDLAKKLTTSIAHYEANFGHVLDLDETKAKLAQGSTDE